MSSVLGCPLRFPRKNDIRFVLYLQLFVRVFTSYLRYLCKLAYSGVQHILCCVFVCISSSCCQFFWNVYLLLHLRYSLLFIMPNYRSLLLLNSIIEVNKYSSLILYVLFIVNVIYAWRFHWYFTLRPFISLHIYH